MTQFIQIEKDTVTIVARGESEDGQDIGDMFGSVRPCEQLELDEFKMRYEELILHGLGEMIN